MPFRPAFWYEVAHQLPDPQSGAPVMRLTSAAAISHNIYGEQPYSSPDGRRVAIIRSTDFNGNYPWCDLLVADLPSCQLAVVQRGVHSQIVNAAWGEHVFYWKPDHALYRTSLLTLDEQRLLDGRTLPPIHCGLSISPDQRYLAYGTAIPGPQAATFGIARVDLASGAWTLIVQHPDLVNPHTQFEPRTGRSLLLQQNLEPRTQPDGSVTSLGSGAILLLVDLDGGHPRRLRVGPPYTSACTGHQAFVPGSERVALTVGARHELPALGGGRGCGNFLVIGPDDEQPQVVNAPEHCFSHVSVSRCGRFFLCDSYAGIGQPVPLVIGSLATGKFRPLLGDCHGSHGPCQWGHAHPYLTADNRYVIFNSEHQGPGQVYAAGVPPGFLESLLS